MNKLFILLALIATPAYAQEPEKEINYYARDFPMFAEADKGSAVEKAYNRTVKANDEYAKVRAQRKEVVPVIKVEGTIIVQVRVDDGRYRPTCSYGSC